MARNCCEGELRMRCTRKSLLQLQQRANIHCRMAGVERVNLRFVPTATGSQALQRRSNSEEWRMIMKWQVLILTPFYHHLAHVMATSSLLRR